MHDWLQELRDRWDDPYWWADHPVLRTVLITIAAGTIGLLFTLAELRMRSHFTEGTT